MKLEREILHELVVISGLLRSIRKRMGEEPAYVELPDPRDPVKPLTGTPRHPSGWSTFPGVLCHHRWDPARSADGIQRCSLCGLERKIT